MECLDSIARVQTHTTIVIVDNNSLDETIERITQWILDHPTIHVNLVRNETNVGFAKAVNQGVNAIFNVQFSMFNGSPPDFFLLLNPDTVLESSTIHNLMDEVMTDPMIAIVTPRLVSRTGLLRLNIGRFPTFLRLFLQALRRKTAFGWIITNPKEYTFTHDIAWGAATCWLVRNAAWKKLNGFDEEYFLYIEDVDFCRRARALRWRIRFVPQSVVIHHQQLSVGPILLKANKWELHGLLYYYQTTFPTHRLRLKFLRWFLMTKWKTKKILRHGLGPV